MSQFQLFRTFLFSFLFEKLLGGLCTWFEPGMVGAARWKMSSIIWNRGLTSMSRPSGACVARSWFNIVVSSELENKWRSPLNRCFLAGTVKLVIVFKMWDLIYDEPLFFYIWLLFLFLLQLIYNIISCLEYCNKGWMNLLPCLEEGQNFWSAERLRISDKNCKLSLLWIKIGWRFSC